MTFVLVGAFVWLVALALIVLCAALIRAAARGDALWAAAVREKGDMSHRDWWMAPNGEFVEGPLS